jgi:ketosteroid isomerase-like protein
MQPDKPDEFASRWADMWNRRAVEEVLSLFSDDTVFTSPTALAVVGVAEVRGKEALRAYWNKAMWQIQTLQFTVNRVVWDATRRELAVIYTALINGKGKCVSENFIFDAAGLIRSAEVFHGAPT